MAASFSDDVQSVFNPYLATLGFQLDAINEQVDEGGRLGAVVFYRADDCRLQVYWSAREHEINAMIAPLDAPREHGLYNRSSQWHYLTEYAETPDLPLEDLVKLRQSEKPNFEYGAKWLDWLKEQVSQQIATARSRVGSSFSTDVQSIVGPLLTGLGFTVDRADPDVDEGGRSGAVVYYRSPDCNIQIYQSSREGSINCVIAPLGAPDVFGPHDRNGDWHYLTRFAPLPDVPLGELINNVSLQPKSTAEQLQWVRGTIAEHFDTARASILEA